MVRCQLWVAVQAALPLEGNLGRSPEILEGFSRRVVARCLRRIPMKKRFKLSRRGSKKMFRKSSGVHPRNFSPSPMRGGIRG